MGGASNTGGVVLRKFFSDQQLRELTPRLDPSRPTGLDFYPLVQPGERFPINDPALPPRLEPRPADDALFLQGERVPHAPERASQSKPQVVARPSYLPVLSGCTRQVDRVHAPAYLGRVQLCGVPASQEGASKWGDRVPTLG